MGLVAWWSGWSGLSWSERRPRLSERLLADKVGRTLSLVTPSPIRVSFPSSQMSDKNQLFYGDNLDVLRRHVKDESVDLVYLDPPFNSNQDYNVLFGRREGHPASAQIQAFEDTWHWDQAAAEAYEEMVELGGEVSKALQSFRTLLGPSDMLAYLAMMAPRLMELHRVLTDTGSIYLHCDPTASHYLKLLMDAVFGPQNFRSEIVWKRSTAHSDTMDMRATSPSAARRASSMMSWASVSSSRPRVGDRPAQQDR